MSDNSPTPPPRDEESENSRSPSPQKDENDESASPTRGNDEEDAKDNEEKKKENDSSVSLYIGNLSYKTDEDQLEELFKPLGTILERKIARAPPKNLSRGYGFITVPDRETADKMIEKFNGTQFDGRTISVEIAKGKRENRRPIRRERYSRDRDRERDRDRYSRRDRYDSSRRRRDSYDYSPRRSRRYDSDDYSPRRRDGYDDRMYRSDRRRRSRYD